MKPETPTLRPERLLLDPALLGVREVLLVGRCRYTSAHPPLADHCHDDVLEICYQERGRQIFLFADGDLRCLSGGAVLVVQPGQVHGTGQFPIFPGHLYWAQFRMPRRGQEMLGLSSAETQSLFAALRRLPRQFVGSPQIRAHFEALFAPNDALGADLKRARFKAEVLQLLFACIASAGLAGQSAPNHSITRALKTMAGDWSERVTVAQMAKSGHLSESYFKRLFRLAMGAPPAEFFRMLRLEKAQVQLRTTRMSVTGIAFANGFSSSQHFAGAFRQRFGCTPRAYRDPKIEEPLAESPVHGAGVEFHPTIPPS